MKQQLELIKKAAEEQLACAETIEALEDARIKYLGKKGELTSILKGMGGLSAEERPVIGALANEVREFLTNAIDSKKAEMEQKLQNEKLQKEVIDINEKCV